MIGTMCLKFLASCLRQQQLLSPMPQVGGVASLLRQHDVNMRTAFQNQMGVDCRCCRCCHIISDVTGVYHQKKWLAFVAGILGSVSLSLMTLASYARQQSDKHSDSLAEIMELFQDEEEGPNPAPQDKTPAPHNTDPVQHHMTPAAHKKTATLQHKTFARKYKPRTLL